METVNKIMRSASNAANNIGDSAGNFGPEVWTVLALTSVIGGYFLLRGNVLK